MARSKSWLFSVIATFTGRWYSDEELNELINDPIVFLEDMYTTHPVHYLIIRGAIQEYSEGQE